MVKLAGCPPSDSFKDWLSFVFRIPQTSKLLYAVHALKGSSVFYFTKRGGLVRCGTGCPQVFQFLSCFCRRGGWLPCSGLGQRNLFQTRGPVALSGQDEELLQTRGLVALQWSRPRGAFVDLVALQWSRAPGALVGERAGCPPRLELRRRACVD